MTRSLLSIIALALGNHLRSQMAFKSPKALIIKLLKITAHDIQKIQLTERGTLRVMLKRLSTVFLTLMRQLRKFRLQ